MVLGWLSVAAMSDLNTKAWMSTMSGKAFWVTIKACKKGNEFAIVSFKIVFCSFSLILPELGKCKSVSTGHPCSFMPLTH